MTGKSKGYLIKKGDTIIAVRLTPNDGLIQTNPDDNPDGHVVFQPFEGFNIEDILMIHLNQEN